jgi:hypothetical protein
MCIFTLKEIINFYLCNGSPVYICCLDASKAFDKLNHWLLFTKLIKRGINPLFVRILVFWYNQQEFVVKWGPHCSDKFFSSNGVRQGGIMSPILFNVYMGDLSVQLSHSNVGCNINGLFINHLFYADDCCLIIPAPSALQKLLDIC